MKLFPTKKSETHVPSRSVIVSTAIFSLLLMIGIGTFIFHRLEDWTWIQAFYFTVATISTVGYGDLTPSNDTTRLVVAIFILLGVTVTVSALGVLGDSYLESRSKKGEK